MMNIHLNKVDQEIKSMLLTYPSIFNSRAACLRQLFMINGNGYNWTDDGCLKSYASYETVMKYHDLEDTKFYRESLQPNLNLKQKWDVQLSREYMLRKHIEDNIDVYASQHIEENYEYKINLEWIIRFNPDWCCLSTNALQSFPTYIDIDWKNAALEIMNMIKITIFNHLGMYNKSFNRKKSCKDNRILIEKYDKVCTIIDKLNNL